MALARTGTQFIVKGFSQYIGAIRQINREYDKVNQSAKKMASSIASAADRSVKANQRIAISNKKLEVTQKNVSVKLDEYTIATKAAIEAAEDDTNAVLRMRKAEIAYLRAVIESKQAINDKINAVRDAVKAQEEMAAMEIPEVSGIAKAASTANQALGLLQVGFGGVLATIGSVTAVIGTLVGVVGKLAGAFIGAAQFIGNVFAKAISLAIGFVKSLIGAVVKLGSTILNVLMAPLRVLGTFISRTLSVAFGVLIRDSVRALISALRDLKDALISVIAEFQTLEIRIENLVARELRLSGAASNVADSFSAAIQPASELSQWIRQLSMQVPFDINVLANTTAFAMAMGFTSEEAKSLTLSISNFAAGMGLASDKMESIIFNFGQMKAAGKVTGTEMRDLARGAFLPLTDVLDEAAKILGVASDNIVEFRKQAAAGEVPIEAFFQAFQNVVARDFPEAVERMGKTLSGVRIRFINFLKTIVGVEAFGPVAKRVAEVASNALDRLMTPAVMRTAAAFGRALEIGFDLIRTTIFPLIDALRNLASQFGYSGTSAEKLVYIVAVVTAVFKRVIERVTEFINELAKKSDEGFEGLSSRFAKWGAGMIISLAKGMASALSAVVTVLLTLGRIIASFLETHSPPKLLPYLDKWGAEAMTEYMKGWKNADFSVFEDIAGKVEGYVRSLTTNILPEIDVVPMILKLRDQIAKAVSGKISINQIFTGFKNATPELKSYVSALVKVGKATKEVEKAQEALNKVNEKYDKILDPLYKELDRLTDATTDFDDARKKSLLGLIKTDVNASEGDKRRAQLEIDRLNLEKKIRGVENDRDDAVKTAEDALEAAQKNLDFLQAELEAKEALVDVQIKTNELIKEQLALLESLKDAAGGGGGLPTPEDALEGLGDLGFDPGTAFDFDLSDIDFVQIFTDAQTAVDKFFDETLPGLLGGIEEEFAPLNTQLEELGTVWGGVWDDLEARLTTFSETVDETIGEQGAVATALNFFKGKIYEVFGEFLVSAAPGFALFGASLHTIASGIERVLEALGLGDEGDAKSFWENLQFIAGAASNAGAILNGLASIIVSTFLNALANAIAPITEWWENVKERFTDGKVTIIDILWFIFYTSFLIWSTFKNRILNIVSGFIEAVIEFFQNLYDRLVGKSIIPDMLDDITEAWATFITQSLEDIQGWIDSVTAKFTQWALDIYAQGVALVQGLWDGMVSLWPKVVEWVEDHFGWLLQILRDLGVISSPSKVMYEQGRMLMKGLADGIKDYSRLPIEAMMGAANMVVDAGLVPEGNNTTVNNNNYTLNMPTTSTPASVQRAFGVMRLMNT